MNRILASALLIGASTLGLVGCDQTSKVEDTKTIKTPGGSEKITTTTEDKKSGDAKEPSTTTPAPATTTETPK